MKYTKTCETCGHIETAFTQPLNEGKVNALRKLVDFYELHNRPAKMNELRLSNSQYTNFGHLAYWDFARYIKGSPSGWVPTDWGVKFIYGEATVLTPVAIMNKSPLPYYHEAWKTHGKDPRPVKVQDIDIVSYKQKEEYQQEKTKTLL